MCEENRLQRQELMVKSHFIDGNLFNPMKLLPTGGTLMFNAAVSTQHKPHLMFMPLTTPLGLTVTKWSARNSRPHCTLCLHG